MKNKIKILFSTPVLKYPAIGGPFLRIENSIKALSEISELYINYRESPLQAGGNEAVKYYKNYCRRLYFSKFNYSNLVKVPINIFSEKIFNTRIFDTSCDSEENYRKFLDLAEEVKPDLIWLGYGNISYPLLFYIKRNSKYKVILDTDSVLSSFLKREAEFIKEKILKNKYINEANKKEKEEKLGTELADITTAVSEFDSKYYQNLLVNGNKNKIKIFSNVVDLAKYRKSNIKSDIQMKKPNILLTGSFSDQSPMKDSAIWFIKEILPLIKTRIKDINFYIIGPNSKEVLDDISFDKNIFVLGEVVNIIPYMSGADVAVVPLRFESGTRFKILEAGACRTPVVSTYLGAEGLNMENKKNIILADTVKKFADGVVRLISNRKEALVLSSNLRKTVEEQYSLDSLIKEGELIIDYLFNNK